VQKRTEIGQAADRNRRHQKKGATVHVTAEKQFEDGLTLWGFTSFFECRCMLIRPPITRRPSMVGLFIPNSWSFEQMILKPHTSYTVRQIKRPFFLVSIPTKDGCSYVQLDHVEISSHVCPSCTSISSAQTMANESRNYRQYPNGNSYL